MRRLALALGLLAMAGCTGLPFAGGEEEQDSRLPLVCEPAFGRPPCGAGVGQGVPYRFALLTHCGIEWAYFDGRYWVPRPKVQPPSHWASIEPGTMVLVRREEAVFEAEAGGAARFVPAAESFRPRTCA